MVRILLSGLVLLTVVAWFNLTAPGVDAVTIKNLAGCTDNSLAANDDGSTDSIPLPFTLNFFGDSYSALFVNNNGNVTFDSSLSTFTPFNLITTSRVIIAPFFADVDTRGTGSSLATYGATTFSGRTAFCVNWVNVGYYASRTDKLNSFQLLLIDRSDIAAGDFDIMFNYDQIDWETGEASSGIDGLGGDSARVGYSNGSTTAFELPGSASNGAFLDSSPSGLVHNSRNSLQNGRYIFPVRSGAAPTGGTISGHVYAESIDPANALAGAPVQLCSVDGPCNTTTTNSAGEYSVSGLSDGQYVGSAFPPAASELFPGTIGPITMVDGISLADQDFVLTLPRPLPNGVTIDSVSTTSSGAPVINWATSNQITITNEPDCLASYELTKDGVVIASGLLTELTPGFYKGAIPALLPQHGPAVLTFSVTCPDPADSKVVDVDVYIDPSGNVRTVSGDPIEGATVTLLRSDSSSGPFEVVPDGSAIMSPSNRTNPDTTDAAGFFHWDVIAGFYIVRAEAEGCVSPNDPTQDFAESAVLTIPPPVTDLDIRLNCSGEALLAGDVNCDGSANSLDAALVLQFSAGLVSALNCQAAGDTNGDDSLNSIDAALILQFDAGLIDELPV